MQTFLLKLCHEAGERRLCAVCSIVGEPEGFDPLARRFAAEEDLVRALEAAGIQRSRYQSTLDAVRSGEESSFEIGCVEAQKMDVLHIDSTE
jgi:hypothetical protein